MVILTNKRAASCFTTIALLIIFSITGVFYYATAAEPTPSSSPENSVPLPILMYHFVIDNPKNIDKYTVTPKQLESDFEYIQKNGYTPISSKELIDYVSGTNPAPLPAKPILLTFDDGYFNNYSYAFPLLKKYNYKAVISVIGSKTDEYSNNGKKPNNTYSHATWTELKEMQDSGLVEIGNHTYDLHNAKKRNGIVRKRGESMEKYEQMLFADVNGMQQILNEKIGKPADVFAYPFGNSNKESEAIINKMNFSITLGCYERVNYIVVGKTRCLQNMKRYNRSGRKSIESIL